MTEIIKIQKEHLVNGKSINEIANDRSHSWATVNTVVNCSIEAIKTRGRRPNKISAIGNKTVLERIRFYLNFKILHDIKRKQRFTTNFL